MERQIMSVTAEKLRFGKPHFERHIEFQGGGQVVKHNRFVNGIYHINGVPNAWPLPAESRIPSGSFRFRRPPNEKHTGWPTTPPDMPTSIQNLAARRVELGHQLNNNKQSTWRSWLDTFNADRKLLPLAVSTSSPSHHRSTLLGHDGVAASWS